MDNNMQTIKNAIQQLGNNNNAFAVCISTAYIDLHTYLIYKASPA